MRVQLVINPHDETRSWTLLDNELCVVEPVEAFLAHISAIGRSPNTIRAYALDLQDFFTYLNYSDLRWDRLQLEDVGRFVPWLGLSDEARAGGASTLPMRSTRCAATTVNRKLAAVSSFYLFHARHGVALSESMTAWQRQGRLAGPWEPFLAHLGNQPVRRRVLALKTHRRYPRALAEDEVDALMAACNHLRDRFLFTLLRSAGLRIGEALGLRHEDINPRRCELSVRFRENTNYARAKTNSRVVPVSEHVISLYADYLHDEYGDLDSDYVFINLWAQPIGSAMRYSAVHELVGSLRQRTGVAFTPHMFRHTYATELLRSGVAAEVVRALLGHASVATTIGTYAHLNADDIRRALVKAGML